MFQGSGGSEATKSHDQIHEDVTLMLNEFNRIISTFQIIRFNYSLEKQQLNNPISMELIPVISTACCMIRF
jgi:hypothetical protein